LSAEAEGEIRAVSHLDCADRRRIARRASRRFCVLCEALEPRRLLSVAVGSISGTGDATTGSITGVLYNDLNNNNHQDSGESGLAGWTVFLDANKNGRLDPGEVSTTTNSSGQYTFSNLTLGTYVVSEVLPAGYIQSIPGASGLSPGVVTSVTLSASSPRAHAADLSIGSGPAGQTHPNVFLKGTAPLGAVAPDSGVVTSAVSANPAAAGAALLSAQQVTPSEYDTAYGLSSLTFGSVPANGAGQTIAIIDAYNDPNIASDLAEFDSYFGVAAPPSFQVVSETGSTTALPTDSGTSGWSLEESLDVEWAHAVAPAANIILVEANSTSYSDLFTAVDWARNDPGVTAVSMSFSGTESSSVYNSYNYHFTTPPGHPGVTFLAATGDYGIYAGQGSTTVAVGYPASSSEVVAVGGTTLLLADSTGDYGSESAWGSGTSSNTAGGGGGGISKYNSQPPYQTGIVTQSTSYRTTPDIALDADPNSGAWVIDSYDYPGYLVGVGGTSFATPSMAGMIAIADQGRALAGEAPLDGPTQTLPAIYQLPAADFHDITTGNNGDAAGPGYDLATGRGSPIGNLFIPGLVGYNSQQPVTELSVTLTSRSSNATAKNFPDQFTDLPPTVATQPTATATNSAGIMYALNVLGASATGASKLVYTWSVGSDAPGTVTFSANNTNAAKTATATFSVAGDYTLSVQITDAVGLFTTASVMVNATAASNSLAGTLLTVTGTPAADTIALTTASGELTVTLNGVAGLPELLSQISAVQILGGNGNDVISLDPNVPPTSIVGGTGIDTVNTSATALVTFTDSAAAAGLIKQGAGILTLDAANSFASTTISAGTLLVSSVGALPAASVVIDNASLVVNANTVLTGLSGSGGLTIGDDAVLQLAATASTSSIASLTINAGSQLDITNNAILVSESADPLSSVAAMVNSGDKGGLWSGSGIVSSLAASIPGRTVGYGDWTAIASIPAGDAEAKFTVPGDVNLDGTVDINDLAIAINNLGLPAGYQGGDIDNQGVVSITDIVTIINDLGATLPA
jgi:autotransporter-associated beta strand protein